MFESKETKRSHARWPLAAITADKSLPDYI